MSKYITEFNTTGNSTVNVNLICKHWNERFSICTWINTTDEKYTFVVYGKRKNRRLCKTQISKEQANQIIEKLKLIHIRSGLFRSGGAYHSKEYVMSECERLQKIKEEKEQELGCIRDMLIEHERALL